MRYGVYYNSTTLKDTLMIIYSEDKYPTKTIKSNDVAVLFNGDERIGINIFHFSKYYKFNDLKSSYIPILSKDLFETINNILKNEKLDAIEYQSDSGFKVGKIIECEPHPDSETLHLLKVDIGEAEPLSIVCGSFNAKEGIKAVCATLYSFLPSGKQILPSKILNIPSFGMMCSGKELKIEGYENKRGLYILDDSYNVGDDFFATFAF